MMRSPLCYSRIDTHLENVVTHPDRLRDTTWDSQFTPIEFIRFGKKLRASALPYEPDHLFSLEVILDTTIDLATEASTQLQTRSDQRSQEYLILYRPDISFASLWL